MVKTMSKIRVSMKYIRNVWRKTFCCGYCDLQYIFRYEEPAYYNSGIYGWNCDIYCDYKRDIAITTGYRNMTGKRIPSELIEKYTAEAKKILENMGVKPYYEYMAEIAENREKFFNELENI